MRNANLILEFLRQIRHGFGDVIIIIFSLQITLKVWSQYIDEVNEKIDVKYQHCAYMA